MVSVHLKLRWQLANKFARTYFIMKKKSTRIACYAPMQAGGLLFMIYVWQELGTVELGVMVLCLLAKMRIS